MAAGKKILTLIKKNRNLIRVAEKKHFRKTESKLIVRIPLVGRLTSIAIEPQPIVITFDFKHVRIAIAVSYVQHAVYFTALRLTLRTVFYLGYIILKRTAPSIYFFFKTAIQILRKKHIAICALNMYVPNRS